MFEIGQIKAQDGDPNSGFARSPAEWFNTAVFSTPVPGTYGDSRKGSLRGPYFEDLDLAFSKNFAITERHNLQYRLELFNVGSNWHAKNDFFGSNLIPGNNISSGGGCTFGSLAGIVNTSISGCTPDGTTPGARLWYPRTLQMSLVYSF